MPQLTLDYSRAQQLAILRECRLGDPRKKNDRKPIAKLLLRTLDDRIGKAGRWSLLMVDLAAEADVAPPTAYKWCAWLNAHGFIGFDELPDGRREFWICWNALWATTPEGRAATKKQATPVLQNRTTLYDVEPDSTTENRVLCGRAHIRISAHSAPTERTTSPPTPSIAPDRSVIVERVREAGVSQCAEAVAAALANGLTLDDLAAILDDWAAHRRADQYAKPAGRLYHHLTSPSTVGAGRFKWPQPDRPRGPYTPGPVVRDPTAETDAREAAEAAHEARRKALDKLHGATLAGLSDDDCLALLAHRPRLLDRYRGRDDPVTRFALLEALDANQTPTPT